MSSPKERVLDVLRPMLEAAVGDKVVLEAELVKNGIPRRYADGISRASRNLQSTEDAQALADDWADTIATDLERDRAKGTDPAELAAHVPRW